MNSSITYYSHPKRDGEPIIEEVYGIIDTKIQYIDYQTNQAILPYLSKDTISGGSTFGRSSATSNASQQSDNFLDKIELNSKKKHLLLIIRTMLCFQNARIAFDLLTDNKFLNYTEKHLKKIMDSYLSGVAF